MCYQCECGEEAEAPSSFMIQVTYEVKCFLTYTALGDYYMHSVGGGTSWPLAATLTRICSDGGRGGVAARCLLLELLGWLRIVTS